MHGDAGYDGSVYGKHKCMKQNFAAESVNSIQLLKTTSSHLFEEIRKLGHTEVGKVKWYFLKYAMQNANRRLVRGNFRTLVVVDLSQFIMERLSLYWDLEVRKLKLNSRTSQTKLYCCHCIQLVEITIS